ncbi:hypothetical protein A2U01_0112833, partial [Trifolium medium]|nr:hypothetical protein [Trifolium medium]
DLTSWPSSTVPERFETPKIRQNSESAEEEREIAGSVIFHAAFHTGLIKFQPAPHRPDPVALF